MTSLIVSQLMENYCSEIGPNRRISILLKFLVIFFEFSLTQNLLIVIWLGISYDSAPEGIEIRAHDEHDGKIQFNDQGSYFHERLYVSSAGHTVVNTSVDMNTWAWFRVDANCDDEFIRGILYIVSLDSTPKYLYQVH